MNNTIYVCTKGSYSDYHICGVFDDKKLAKEFCKKFCKDAEIEEWEINPYRMELNNDYTPYLVIMSIDGNVIKIEDTEFDGLSMNSPYINYHNNMCVIVIAKSEEHAIKIANEHRTQLIALNRWE